MGADKDRWDKLSIVGPLVVTMLIAIVGGTYVFFSESKRDAELREAELAADLIPYLTSEDQKTREYATSILAAGKTQVMADLLCVGAQVFADLKMKIARPTENTDGSPLLETHIVGYRLSIGIAPGNYTIEQDIDAVLGQSDYEHRIPIDGHPGNLYVAIQTIKNNGKLSGYSKEYIVPVPNFSVTCN